MASLALLHLVVDHNIVHHDHQIGLPLPPGEDASGSATGVGNPKLVIVA